MRVFERLGANIILGQRYSVRKKGLIAGCYSVYTVKKGLADFCTQQLPGRE